MAVITMRTLLVLFLSLSSAAAQLNVSRPAFVAAVLKPAAGGGGGGGSFPSGATHNWTLNEAVLSCPDIPGSLVLSDYNEASISSVAGKNGNALEFNSPFDGYLQYGLLALEEPFTVALWLKLDSTADGDILHVNSYSISIRMESGSIASHLGQADPGGDTLTSALSDTSSYHLVVAKSVSGACYLSVDGATFTSGSTAGGAYPGSIISFGASSDYFGTAFDGKLDAVTIWPTGLSQGQVTDIWNAGTGRFY